MKGDENPATPAKKAAQAVEKPVAQAQRNVFGGHNEMWWRSAFRNLRTEQKMVQNGLPGKKEQLAVIHRRHVIYQKASYREAYNKLNQEIANDEAHIKELQDKLDALDRDAGTAGVPKEWRQ